MVDCVGDRLVDRLVDRGGDRLGDHVMETFDMLFGLLKTVRVGTARELERIDLLVERDDLLITLSQLYVQLIDPFITDTLIILQGLDLFLKERDVILRLVGGEGHGI